MFVKTQFETVVNVANFDKIKIEWHVKNGSENVHHIISAVSEERHQPQSVGEPSVIVSKSETLAEFPEDMADEAQRRYHLFFQSLLEGETGFDITEKSLVQRVCETEERLKSDNP